MLAKPPAALSRVFPPPSPSTAPMRPLITPALRAPLTRLFYLCFLLDVSHWGRNSSTCWNPWLQPLTAIPHLPRTSTPPTPRHLLRVPLTICAQHLPLPLRHTTTGPAALLLSDESTHVGGSASASPGSVAQGLSGENPSAAPSSLMDTPVPTRWGDDECTDLPPPLAPHVEEVFSETGGVRAVAMKQSASVTAHVAHQRRTRRARHVERQRGATLISSTS